MIYADSAAEIETRRKAFLRKWKLKCRAVADSLEEAGDRREYPKLCVSERAHAVFRYGQASKRPANIMAS